jgi:uncharacterized protein YegL
MRHIILLIDNSYSMKNHIANVVSGINRFVTTLKAASKPNDTFLSIVSFSTRHEYVLNAVDVYAVPLLELHHFMNFGLTSLYDSIVAIVSEWLLHNEEYRIQRNSNDDVFTEMFIVSDGDDQSSILYTREQAVYYCEQAIHQFGWNITHCHVEIDKLCDSVKHVTYDIKNVETLFDSLKL